MRFKLDENLPYRAADTFGEVGHDADTVYDEDLAGQPDEVVAAAVSENRVFGDAGPRLLRPSGLPDEAWGAGRCKRHTPSSLLPI